MKYQLVLQVKADSLADYDAMIGLENALIEELGDTAEVDGHDFGSGEANIFIFTPKPEMTFERAKPLLQKTGCLGVVIAAYRLIDGEDYTVIWPKDSKELFSIV